eukprot:GHVL01014804.1.p1 GENE.GHVL01014804.1~~GHVL01014804.1.p1  ORF type:complete len:243 (+),score=49.60 GHVL01014804.1:21-749(+)
MPSPKDILATTSPAIAAGIVNPRVYLDITISGKDVGKLVFELFMDDLPITSENFRCLCTGEAGLGYWFRPRWYKNTTFHRVIPGFMCQGGDFNVGDGKGGESIYGQRFRDEKFLYKHSKRGVLGMAHNGWPNWCNSQFYITFAPCPWLDEKHVVFGHLIEGDNVLKKIEAVGSEAGFARKSVGIHNCGEIVPDTFKEIDNKPVEKEEDIIDRPSPIAQRGDEPSDHDIPIEAWKKSRGWILW